mmetsp:Transcript_10568/g.30505  ORF Transcript_10568/g.30505 Transcript_10568/m.30505 type:complete len:218 (-) Transcript_10568:923-1576(-)
MHRAPRTAALHVYRSRDAGRQAGRHIEHPHRSFIHVRARVNEWYPHSSRHPLVRVWTDAWMDGWMAPVDHFLFLCRFCHRLELGLPRPKPTCTVGPPDTASLPEGSVVRFHQPRCSYAMSSLKGFLAAFSFCCIFICRRMSRSRPPIIISSSANIIVCCCLPPFGLGMSNMVPLRLLRFRLSWIDTSPSSLTVMGTRCTVLLPHLGQNRRFVSRVNS